jgi:hypothetical protein
LNFKVLIVFYIDIRIKGSIHLIFENIFIDVNKNRVLWNMIYEIFLLSTSDENFDYVKDIEVNIALTLG